VLSDEIYGRLQYAGSHVCLPGLYPEGTVLTSGFSKWSSAGGWRLGYAHYPPGLRALRAAVLSGASHTYSCAPAPLQHAVARALARDGPELTAYTVTARKVLAAVASYCQVTGQQSQNKSYFNGARPV
jgi:aspartate/methionine/tyrosine aminotransferase